MQNRDGYVEQLSISKGARLQDMQAQRVSDISPKVNAYVDMHFCLDDAQLPIDQWVYKHIVILPECVTHTIGLESVEQHIRSITPFVDCIKGEAAGLWDTVGLKDSTIVAATTETSTHPSLRVGDVNQCIMAYAVSVPSSEHQHATLVSCKHTRSVLVPRDIALRNHNMRHTAITMTLMVLSCETHHRTHTTNASTPVCGNCHTIPTNVIAVVHHATTHERLVQRVKNESDQTSVSNLNCRAQMVKHESNHTSVSNRMHSTVLMGCDHTSANNNKMTSYSKQPCLGQQVYTESNHTSANDHVVAITGMMMLNGQHHHRWKHGSVAKLNKLAVRMSTPATLALPPRPNTQVHKMNGAWTVTFESDHTSDGGLTCLVRNTKIECAKTAVTHRMHIKVMNKRKASPVGRRALNVMIRRGGTSIGSISSICAKRGSFDCQGRR